MGRIPPFFLILIAIITGAFYSDVSQAMGLEEHEDSADSGIIATSFRRTQTRSTQSQNIDVLFFYKLTQAAVEKKNTIIHAQTNKINALTEENTFLKTQLELWYRENLRKIEKNNNSNLRRLSSENLKRQTMLEDDIHARSCWQSLKAGFFKICGLYY